MAALEVELGMPLKDIKTLVEVNKKPKQVLSGETLSGTDLKIAKMEALMTAGVPSKQIPLLLQHLNISGKTREEIQTSIVQLIDLKLLSVDAPANQEANQQQQGSPNAAQGAGNTGVPLGTGKKTFTLAEVRDKSKDPGWYEANRAAVQEAMAKGEIK
jgi:DNA-binding transcriptional MerR regulator